MTRLQLGPIGASVTPGEGNAFLDATAELADLGVATIWLAGGQLQRLQQLADVVDATRTVQVGSGIISVDRFDRAAVAALYAEIDARHPGRFLVGLGGAHGPRPLRALATYLDGLDSVAPTVPVAARVLAALGPRMLELARDRAAGAYPFFVTPGYTAQARSLLGEDTALVVGQFVVVEPDPQRARELARGRLRFLSTAGGYAANLRRMGFSDEEIAQLADRLIDAVVAWGDLERIVERVEQHLAAGADQVALSVLSAAPPGSLPMQEWRQLASALASQLWQQ